MSDYNRDVLETYALERIKELKEDPESFNQLLRDQEIHFENGNNSILER